MPTHKQDAPGQNKEYDIIINGDPVTVSQHKITYEELVNLSGLQGTNMTTFLISYEKGVGNAQGHISAGECIVVKNGMVFDVSNSNRS